MFIYSVRVETVTKTQSIQEFEKGWINKGEKHTNTQKTHWTEKKRLGKETN